MSIKSYVRYLFLPFNRVSSVGLSDAKIRTRVVNYDAKSTKEKILFLGPMPISCVEVYKNNLTYSLQKSLLVICHDRLYNVKC